MKTVEITETNNGFVVVLDNKTYVFRSIDALEMLAFVGKHFYGKKVDVKEH